MAGREEWLLPARVQKPAYIPAASRFWPILGTVGTGALRFFICLMCSLCAAGAIPAGRAVLAG